MIMMMKADKLEWAGEGQEKGRSRAGAGQEQARSRPRAKQEQGRTKARAGQKHENTRGRAKQNKAEQGRKWAGTGEELQE